MTNEELLLALAHIRKHRDKLNNMSLGEAAKLAKQPQQPTPEEIIAEMEWWYSHERIRLNRALASPGRRPQVPDLIGHMRAWLTGQNRPPSKIAP